MKTFTVHTSEKYWLGYSYTVEAATEEEAAQKVRNGEFIDCDRWGDMLAVSVDDDPDVLMEIMEVKEEK